MRVNVLSYCPSIWSSHPIPYPEGVYFAFGENDDYHTLDLPDNATAATISLAVKKSGAGHTRTIVLLTPEEIDQAAKQLVDFQPTGWQVQDVANAIDRMIEEGGKDLGRSAGHRPDETTGKMAQ